MPIRWLMTNVPQKTCVTSANWTICLILLGISFAASAAPVLPWSDEGIMAELSRRALLMDDAIHATMLVDGLVTNKLHGEPDDVCDSLLWSSIRAASLYNMGQLDRYNEAVIALRRSTVGPGQWRRHPRCGKTLSRDMIDGLLVLAATDPVGNAATLHATALYIQSNWGFIASSISPTSLMSPNQGYRMRSIAAVAGIPSDDLPLVARFGEAIENYLTVLPKKGYRRHLVAMSLLQDLILWRRHDVLPPIFAAATAIRLERDNPENLLFSYLSRSFRNGGEPTRAELREIGARLLSMPQFPADGSLPTDCQRSANYLWQKDANEYVPDTVKCIETFAGIDFIWLASMITLPSHAPPRDDSTIAH